MRPPLSVAIAVLFLLGVPVSAQAQAFSPGTDALEDSLAPSAPTWRSLLAGPVNPGTYRLGPGDQLSLELGGRVTRMVPVLVDVEGRINVPDLGVLSVAGRTLEDVRGQLLSRLRPIYPGARVDVRLVQVREFKVYVSGQVRTPGAAVATHTTRASEILRGPFALLDGASRRNIELRHRDGRTQRVDLDEFALLGRTDSDAQLEDGDILVVPPTREWIHALGSFARAGDFEYVPGDSLAGLVALAGGVLPGVEPASGSLVRFVTPTTTDSIPVDLGVGRGAVGDLPLQPEDRVFARAPGDFMRTRNVTVFGEVRFPGPYALRPGEDRLRTLLARAGGPTSNAATGRIQVFRPGVSTSSRDIEFERLSRLTRGEMTDAEYMRFQTKLAAQQATFLVSADELGRGTGEFDVVLEAGDIVVVDRETQAVRVAGQVVRPALVAYEPNRSGEGYIQLAGGFTAHARRSDVRVTRASSNQTLALSDVKQIEPGDFIWVPEKKEANFWGVLKDAILVAGSVATVVLLFHNTTH